MLTRAGRTIDTAPRRLAAIGVSALILCLCAGSGVADAAKPAISSLRAEPATVPSGGTTTVMASVTGALACKLSSTAGKPVAGLPVTFSCEAGNVSRALTMPTNTGKKPAKYKLTLTATGASGAAKAKTSVSVSPTAPGSGVRQRVAAGASHTCAVLSTGHIKCWGDNQFGQLGNDSTGESDIPVEVEDVADATDVGAGEDYTCAVLSTGHIQCWGLNETGQLGNDSTVNASTPVDVHGLSNALQVTGGSRHTCALLSSHHVDCWGANYDGQLGNGSTKSRETPVTVDNLSDAIEVAAGGEHACALLSTGHVDCWGENQFGQLGVGNNSGPEVCPEETASCSRTPVEAQGITDATQVAAGRLDTCARLATGHVQCWGWNEYGQLGDGTHISSAVPVEVQGIADATQVTVGESHACALLSTGHAVCWGEDQFGQLGNAATSGADTPVEVLGIAAATEVTAGSYHTCVLLADSHLQCWGLNYYGEIGNGTATKYADLPVEVDGITYASQVTAGGASCALLPTGHAECWGWNGYGQLGDGTTGPADTPVEVRGISTASLIAGGESHTCAVLSAGRIECWGENFNGELGNGTSMGPEDCGPDVACSLAPVGVQGITDATQVTVGAAHTCALLSTGHIDCWGANEDGQLGDDTTSGPEACWRGGACSTTPVEVQGITDATQLAAGNLHTCAVLTTGHIECWGSDEAGQLGNASAPARTDTPVEVQGITDATHLAAGARYTCATLTAGNIECWGENSNGQLGNGTASHGSNSPTEVQGITNATEVTAGAAHTCALLSTGEMRCWGDDMAGQLGNNTIRYVQDSPVEVQGITDASQVAAGGELTCALLATGHLSCWGENGYGELGNGTAWSTTPAEVLGIP